MVRCLTQEQKYYVMISIQSTFFVVEIVCGYITNSLALVSGKPKSSTCFIIPNFNFQQMPSTCSVI